MSSGPVPSPPNDKENVGGGHRSCSMVPPSVGRQQKDSGGIPMGPPPFISAGRASAGAEGTSANGEKSGAPPLAPGPMRVPGGQAGGGSAAAVPPGQSLMTAVNWSPIVAAPVISDGAVASGAANLPTQPQLVESGRMATSTTGGSSISHQVHMPVPPPPPNPAHMPGARAAAAPASPMGTPPGGLPSQQQQQQKVQTRAKKAQKKAGAKGAGAKGGAIPIPTAPFSIGTSSSSSSSPRLSSSAPGRTNSIATRRASTGSDAATTNPNQRRQKRLERNRESARLSRRRRKQYLEILEERVTYLSEEMDRGRREHVSRALETVRRMRAEKLKEVERDLGIDMADLSLTPSSDRMEAANIPVLEQHGRVLDTSLSRTCDELRIATTFQKQQFLSLVLPQHKKFILWLTVQNDAFYRGGRAASERLSAARIGERMLHCGNDRASPSGGMWPLFCHDVGLSYEQEEKVRNYQRTLIANQETWLHRHTAAASDATVETMHKSLHSLSEMVQRRERSALNVLTVEQRAKFQAWAASRQERIARAAQTLIARASVPSTPEKGSELQCSPERHDAANLYILNDRLQKVCQTLPTAPPLVSATSLKKLSRRPSFESLASSTASLESSGKKLSKEKSFPSTGSLKRAASELSMDEMDSGHGKSKDSVPSITPEAAEEAASPLVSAALNSVRGIIPSSPPREFVPTPVVHSRGHVVQPQAQQQYQHKQPQHQEQVQQQYQEPQYQQQYSQHHYAQVPQVHGQPQTAGYVGAPVPVGRPSHPGATASPMPVEVQSGDASMQHQQHMPANGVQMQPGPSPPRGPGSYVENNHGRIPSVLPPHMSIVPEEGYLNNVSAHGTEEDEFLFDLTEEDWAIGEGFDMDMT